MSAYALTPLLAVVLAAAQGTSAPSQPADPTQSSSTERRSAEAKPAAASDRPQTVAPAPARQAAARQKMTLGDAQVAAHDEHGALLDYLDAINLDSLSAEARLRLAGSYDRLSHLAQAVEQWQIAVELDPSSDEARRLLQRGRTALAQGKSTTVEAPAPPPVEPASKPGVRTVSRAVAELYEGALKLFGARKYAEAARSLDQVVQADPKLAIAFSARGSARFGQALYRDAADDYRQALALDASLALPIYGLAECHRMLEQASAAEEYARYAASTAPDVREELRADARKKASELGRR